MLNHFNPRFTKSHSLEKDIVAAATRTVSFMVNDCTAIFVYAILPINPDWEDWFRMVLTITSAVQVLSYMAKFLKSARTNSNSRGRQGGAQTTLEIVGSMVVSSGPLFRYTVVGCVVSMALVVPWFLYILISWGMLPDTPHKDGDALPADLRVAVDTIYIAVLLSGVLLCAMVLRMASNYDQCINFVLMQLPVKMPWRWHRTIALPVGTMPPAASVRTKKMASPGALLPKSDLEAQIEGKQAVEAEQDIPVHQRFHFQVANRTEPKPSGLAAKAKAKGTAMLKARMAARKQRKAEKEEAERSKNAATDGTTNLSATNPSVEEPPEEAADNAESAPAEYNVVCRVLDPSTTFDNGLRSGMRIVECNEEAVDGPDTWTLLKTKMDKDKQLFLKVWWGPRLVSTTVQTTRSK
mmetsp:Transcript_36776/g.96299  ORF Transcript_36776/g.96299 Transcript_36776/m.96299 type:complete len:409 (+) Transcript_36776:134-1360(+)